MPNPAALSSLYQAHRWPGLGAWNLYFLAKFLLIWLGLLNFQVLPNLLFACALLVPLPGRPLRILRQLVAIPAGIALLYHDTWLPPFDRLLAQPGVFDFSFEYLADLAGRFIDWTLVGVLALLTVGYVYVSQWVRATLLSLAGLAWLALPGLPGPTTQALPGAPLARVAGQAVAGSELAAPAADPAGLDNWLSTFFAREAERRTQFPPRDEAVAPFDVLVINVCSLAWDDLDEVGLRENLLLKRMDLVFDRFNSATSYSGPAAIRLLRASCGQLPHAGLYQPAAEHCLLFENLARLGYQAESLLNHNGRFDSFIDDITAQRLPQPTLGSNDFPRGLVSFDGSAIARDIDVLRGWWKRRQQLGSERVGLYYNTITLHDGNRLVTQDGSSQSASYRTRANLLLDDLSRFLDELEQSGRRVVVMLVPEHGAALHGDRMQIAGMREIPRPSITHVPVGVKFIGMGVADTAEPLRLERPSSFLALSELVARLYAAEAGAPAALDLAALVRDLPETAAVSETAGAQVVEYGGTPYLRLDGKGAWMPYPDRVE